METLSHVEGVRELARTVRQIHSALHAPHLRHKVDPRFGLDRANQDGPRRAFRLGHDVQEPVQSVDEVDVGRSGGGEKIPAPSPTGHSPGLRVVRKVRGVTGRIVFGVDLGLHDAPHELPLRTFGMIVDEASSEQVLRHPNGGAVEKRCRQRVHRAVNSWWAGQ